jgi:hypothetical protein
VVITVPPTVSRINDGTAVATSAIPMPTTSSVSSETRLNQ